MNKISSRKLIPFSKTGHKGAPWLCLDKQMNFGDVAEIQTRYILTGTISPKDGNTPFDKGSDIPELSCSVKSGKATLTSRKLGDNFEQVLKAYFQQTASTLWAWYIQVDERGLIYLMNAQEFEAFTREFARFDKRRQVIRYKTSSGKMIAWLENKLVG